MSNEPIGPRLRALRQASGRTVASVATDAGLSVPYIANLENGRGNPTTNALRRLATALGTELSIEFTTSGPAAATSPAPPSVVKLSRSRRFQTTAAALAEASGQEHQVVSARLISALNLLTEALGGEAGEHDWWRVLDALVLIAEHPA